MRTVVSYLVLVLFGFACDFSSSNQSKWWTEEDRQFIVSELDRTTNELRKEIEGLAMSQWNFKEDSLKWSIGEIVEHLEMQNQLHYREITVLSKAPQHPEFRQITKGKDDYFSKYASDTTRGRAAWYLEPKGKFCSPEAGAEAFFKARGELTKFVKQTNIDLRRQFTYRTPVEGIEVSIGQVPDLHQLLLTGIAHTDRHLRQIREIKKSPEYPQ